MDGGTDDMGDVIQRIHVQAKCPVVFGAFTDASMLREWFCDYAFTQPHDKGRWWMRWDEGNRVEGSYIRVISPRTCIFTWRPLKAPGQTTVKVSLYEAGSQTEVVVVHSGFADNNEWEAFCQRCAQQWRQGLENLKSVLETGIDLRRARRPYLGIRWRLLADGGFEVLEVMDRQGTTSADLDVGDVILSVGQRELGGYGDLVAALESAAVGQEVELLVRRNAQEHAIVVTLGAMTRSEQTLPPQNILARVRDRQLQMQRRLAEVLEGVSELEAETSLGKECWSIKDILAHLSVSERGLHHRMSQIVMRAWDDTPKGDPAMLPETLAATRAYGDTIQQLVARFRQDQSETIAFMRALRPEIRWDKARYRRLSESLDLSEHTDRHIDEIIEMLQHVRADVRRRQRTLEQISLEQTVPAEQGEPLAVQARSGDDPN